MAKEEEEKEIVINLIENLRKELFVAGLFERFLTRKAIQDSSAEIPLGKVQKEIRGKREYLAYLEEVLEEIKSGEKEEAGAV